MQRESGFMVSQPNHSQSSLGIRGSYSSVSARSSRPHASSRSKRYNRSFAGGSSCIPQNEFPIFTNSGDVEITIALGGRTNRYLLHKHTLTRCSGFFEASTSEQWSKASVLAPRSVTGEETPITQWHYELDTGADGDDIPMLVQKDLGMDRTQTSTPAPASSLFGGDRHASNASGPYGQDRSHSRSTNSLFPSVASLSLPPQKQDQDNAPPLSQVDEDLLRDYDNLFRIFYNYPPILEHTSLADAYVECKSLLALADLYDALPVVGPRIDHHLLQFQGRLWWQIYKYPVSYLRLGYLARSKVIFQEALIHVVGKWPTGERGIRSSLPKVVLETIETKVAELEDLINRVEGQLFRLNLMTSHGESVNPQNSFIDWLAVSFFRQWLTDNMRPIPVYPPLHSPPQPPQPPHPVPRHPSRASSRHHTPGREREHVNTRAPPPARANQNASTMSLPTLETVGPTFRILGSAAGSEYLGHDECKRFLKLTPGYYSRDYLRRFERRIDELKTAAREIVRPLMLSELELELDRSSDPTGPTFGSTNYLTCIKVYETDLPWDMEEIG